MDLNASYGELCRQSDIIIAGLPYAMKIVDNTIIWASTEEQLEERVNTVLKRCMENNITEEVQNGQQHSLCRSHHLRRRYPP